MYRFSFALFKPPIDVYEREGGDLSFRYLKGALIRIFRHVLPDCMTRAGSLCRNRGLLIKSDQNQP